MANPIFLSKNYVSSDCTVNVSSNDIYKARIYGQAPLTPWTSAGETSESGYNTTIEVVFYEGLVAASRTFDTVVLQNINLKQFKMQYWNGSAYADIADLSYTTNVAATLRVKLSASITTSKIKLLMQSTIVAGQEKQVGQLWVMLQTFEQIGGRYDHARSDYKEGGSEYLASGKLFSFTIFKKYAAKLNYSMLTKAQINVFKALYDTNSEFVLHLDYAVNIDDIFQVALRNDFGYTEDSLRKLYSISLELAEA